MPGQCRRRSLVAVEFAHVHELLDAADRGEATSKWPEWFMKAYEEGKEIGLGPGLNCITIARDAGHRPLPIEGATTANRDDILVNDLGRILVFDQTSFDERYEVL